MSSELTGAELNLAVATAIGQPAYIRAAANGDLYCVTTEHGGVAVDDDLEIFLSYSTNWEQGGPLIQERKMLLMYSCDMNPYWFARDEDTRITKTGETPLIAAMRALVASKEGGQ